MKDLFSRSAMTLILLSSIQGAELERISTKRANIPPWPDQTTQFTLKNGLLVSRRTMSVNPQETNLWVLDTAGRQVFSKALWIPDAIEVRIRDFSVTADKSLIVSISGMDAAGRVANFLAFVSSLGEMNRLVRTAPFVNQLIAAGPAATIWAFGWSVDRVRKPRAARTGLDEDLFQVYDANGVLLRSRLPRSSFDQSLPGEPATSRGRAFGNSFLLGGQDVVGAYSSLAKQWIEFDADGALVARRLVPLPESSAGKTMVPMAMALAEPGRVFAEMWAGEHIGIYELDRREPAQWKPVTVWNRDTVRQASGNLVGADNEYLVFLNYYTRELTWHLATP